MAQARPELTLLATWKAAFLERASTLGLHRLLTEEDIAISMAAVGKPEENGYAERLMRTIKERVDLTEYEDITDARRDLGRFLDDVSYTKRIHSSLGDLTPAESQQQWIRMRRSVRAAVA